MGVPAGILLRLVRGGAAGGKTASAGTPITEQ
jgi:hypothetical protein